MDAVIRVLEQRRAAITEAETVLLQLLKETKRKLRRVRRQAADLDAKLQTARSTQVENAEDLEQRVHRRRDRVTASGDDSLLTLRSVASKRDVIHSSEAGVLSGNWEDFADWLVASRHERTETLCEWRGLVYDRASFELGRWTSPLNDNRQVRYTDLADEEARSETTETEAAPT